MAIAKTNPNKINENVVSQIAELTGEDAEKKELSRPAEKKHDYSDNLNLKLPRGERDRLKAFCAENHISMTQFILFAIDHLQTDIMMNRCTVSKMGVRTNK